MNIDNFQNVVIHLFQKT